MIERARLTPWLRVVVVTLALLALLTVELPAQDREGGRRSRRSAPKPEDMGAIQVSEDGEDAVISEGRIPVLEFLRYMAQSTGKLVVYPSTTNDPQFHKDMRIDVLHDINRVTPVVAQEILEANGYELYETLTRTGRSILHVSHGQARQRVSAPQVVPMLAGTTEGSTLGDEMLATLQLQLQHADTQLVITALRELLGITGRAGGSVSIVNISSTNTLLIKGKLRILRQVEEIVDAVDQPQARPVIQVIDVRQADATHLAEVLTAFLNKRRLARTFVVADQQASKLVIESRSPERLELLAEIIRQLDVPPRHVPEDVEPENPPERPRKKPPLRSGGGK